MSKNLIDWLGTVRIRFEWRHFEFFPAPFLLVGWNILDMCGAMRHETLTAAIALLYCTAWATPPPVTVVSPCECSGAHGKGRWSVKNDPSTPPTDASAIQSVTPWQIFSWPGIGAQFTWQSERTGIENKWFALTGRVVAVKVEADSDLHLALQDATGNKPGIVVCEVPAKAQWCEIRETVFSWTRTRFPLLIQSTRKLTLHEAPVVAVIGKAFWDYPAMRRKMEQTHESVCPITQYGRFIRL